MNFIVGNDCEFYYKDNTDDQESVKLEENLIYSVEIKNAEYIGFEHDNLIFKINDTDVYIPINSIANIR